MNNKRKKLNSMISTLERERDIQVETLNLFIRNVKRQEDKIDTLDERIDFLHTCKDTILEEVIYLIDADIDQLMKNLKPKQKSTQ